MKIPEFFERFYIAPESVSQFANDTAPPKSAQEKAKSGLINFCRGIALTSPLWLGLGWVAKEEIMEILNSIP